VLLAIGYAAAVATNPDLVHWSIKLLLGLLIATGIGVAVTGIIWAVQTHKNKDKPSSIEQSKSLQIQNQNKNTPKLPSPPELYLEYTNTEVKIENDVQIVIISAFYRITTVGTMRISQVKLHILDEVL